MVDIHRQWRYGFPPPMTPSLKVEGRLRARHRLLFAVSTRVKPNTLRTEVYRHIDSI